MRTILHCYDRFFPKIGGIESYISSIIQYFDHYKFDVLTNAIPNYPRNDIFLNKSRVIRMGPSDYSLSGSEHLWFNKIIFPGTVLADIARQNNKIRYLKNNNYDIIHFHGAGILGTNIFYLLNRFIKKPLFLDRYDYRQIAPRRVLTIHGLHQKLSNNELVKFCEDCFIDQFDEIICVDSHIYTHLMNTYGDDPSRNVYYIPNSVDVHKYKYSEIPDRENLVVGFIGRLERSRGLDSLYQLIENLPNFAELWIIGAGNSTAIKKFWSEVIKRRPDMSRIKFYSNIANSEIPSYLQNIDILFNPVAAEGISRITLESMSCGRPVIMFNIGDRYPVIPYQNGFLVEDDINQILSLLQYLYENRSVLKTMGRNSRGIIELEFRNESIMPKIDSVYANILDGL